VSFVDTRDGWAVGEGGEIISTRDGGQTWTPKTSGFNEILEGVSFVDTRDGWAVGNNGTIISTNDGGQKWTRQTNGVPTVNLESVSFVNLRDGWAVGDNGTIISTGNGGRTWATQTSHVTEILEGVSFINSRTGWAVGNNGTVISTTDGGRNWTSPLKPYVPYPPPFLWAALVISVGFVVHGLRVRHEPLPYGPIAGRLDCDKPLAAEDFDALNLGPIAAGLSRLFRNRDTAPPMTIAIVADWGFGKSSLMSLIKNDLEKHGVHPVWFNAWHHRTEEHLLAYLLKGITEQSIPPLLSGRGLWFRARLLSIRCLRHWFRVSLWSLLLCFIAGFAYTNGIDSIKPFIWSGTQWEAVAKISSGLVGMALAIIFFYQNIGVLIKPFGASPASLLRAVGEAAPIRQLEAKTSFRMAFAELFHDVTRALAHSPMVIFIDDLDRCPHDTVVQILEATNFLVSAGDCFVVLGIAKKMVLAAVALAYDKIAEEVAEADVAKVPQDTDEVATDSDVSKTRSFEVRRTYAQNYLNKLIHLEVSIPPISSDQTRGLIMREEKKPRMTPGERVTRWLDVAGTVLFSVLIMVIAVEIFHLGDTITLPSLSTPTPSPIITSPVLSTVTSAPSSYPSPRPTAQPTPVKTAAREPIKIPAFSPIHVRAGAGVDARDWWWYEIFGPLVLPFLSIWSEFLTTRCRSPREIKRSVNYIRYLAMRSRNSEPQLSLLERSINWLAMFVRHLVTPGNTQPKTEENITVDSEPTRNPASIVCMALTAHLGVDRNDCIQYSTADLDPTLQAALVEHQRFFGSLPSRADWKWFDTMAGEVRIHDPNRVNPPSKSSKPLDEPPSTPGVPS
jgi:hypothetical protein